MNSWLTLLPPIIAISIAVTLRQAYLALFSGILIGSLLLKGELFSGIVFSFDSITQTFQSASSVKSILFILMIGALINVMYQSDGIQHMIEQLSEHKRLIKSKRSAQLITFFMGFLMCLEGIGSMMMVGLVGRPLFAKYNISKAKLAYVANSTSAPLAWLLPISGAGVFLASLVSIQIENGVLKGDAISYIFDALPYQFYTILVLVSVPLFAVCKHDFNFGHSEYYSEEDHMPKSDPKQDKISIFSALLPVIILLGSIISLTLITGNGNPLQGNISNAIYWSGIIAQLGTGTYLATFISSGMPLWIIPTAIFLLGMTISFSTGSSGATVSILTPIAIPLSISIGMPVPIAIGAVISGAVFGDQSSPISDSVIVAASAADCQPEHHFMTQLPFTLSFASISIIAYLLLGLSL